MDVYIPGAAEPCLTDMRSLTGAGYSWENDILPVLDAVREEAERRVEAVRSFRAVTEHMDGKISRRFSRTVDADVILYFGLCSGAGWVTPVNGKTAVLLGIEKIIELGWCGENDMFGLIAHELGHVYQDQYGVLRRDTDILPDRFLWRLFTEGVAAVFEQEIIGDASYFHQDKDGWLDWCEAHAGLIKRCFAGDLETMTPGNQRWFGDWVSFDGHGDTGYWLGARFVRFLLLNDSFDRVILYDIPAVREGFERFIRINL